MRKNLNAKSWLSVLGIILVLAGTVVGCIFLFKGQKTNKIVVSTFPIYEICREILGGDNDILLLQDNGADLHNFQPTTRDIASLSKADIFIHIGGHSDTWAEGILRSANNQNLKTLALIDEVDIIPDSDENIVQPNDDVHNHNDHGDDEHDDEIDEHIWMSLKNMVKMTTAIESLLKNVYPDEKDKFEQNASSYITKLNELEQRYSIDLTGKTTSLLIADRFPFRYLTHDYGIGYHAAFSSCSTETNATTSTVASMIDMLITNQLSYILVLESSDKQLANSIITSSGRTDVEILVVNSCQSVKKSDLGNVTYLTIMEENLQNLKKALGV